MIEREAVLGEVTVLHHRKRDPEIQLTKRPVTLPSGRSFDAYRLSAGGNTRGAVIIAIRGDDLLLVHSYRPSIEGLIWELPRGFGEGDPHDPRQAEQDAMRELREETGYEAVHAEFLSEVIVDTTFYPSRLAVVTCEVFAPEPSHEIDGEVVSHKWVAFDSVAELIRTGVLRDGATLAALSIYSACRPHPS